MILYSMSQEIFAGARAKITRSLVHYHSLREAIERYETQYGATVEKVTEADQNLYKARISAQPATEISVIVGDFVHNLRSALDYATCALVEAADPLHPLTRVQFPFGRPGQALNSRERQNLGRSPALIEILEKARQAGGHALILLNEMSNQDKHRLLVASVIRQQKAQIEVDFSQNKANIVTSPALDTAMWNRPLSDGDVLAVDTDASPAVGLMLSFIFGLVIEGRDDALPINELHAIGQAVERAVKYMDASAEALRSLSKGSA